MDIEATIAAIEKAQREIGHRRGLTLEEMEKLADAIHQREQELNGVIRRAAALGLDTEIDVLSVQTIGARTRPEVSCHVSKEFGR